MIVDASVALKWVVVEADTRAATRLLNRLDLAAPDHLPLELANALTRIKRQGRISEADANDAWMASRAMPVDLVGWNSLATTALALSLALGAAFYDCLYLALALDRDEQLITADERFARAVNAHPEFTGRVITLSSLRYE